MKRIQSFIVCFLLTWFWFSAPAQNNLSAYEYWFNNSYDNRQTFSINSAEEHYFIENIDVSVLPDGVNVLNIRHKDQNNLYSSTLSKIFYKPPVNQELSKNLTGYEIWFNNDYENKQTHSVSASTGHHLLTEVDVSALPDGVNVLNIRYKNQNNLYSSTLSKMFYKPPVNQELSENLTGYEMWFNNDYENRQTNSISASTGHHLLTEVDVSALPDGVNVLNIRYKNGNNLYSSTLSKMFYKMEQNYAGDNAVTAYKYWFDDDFENAVFVQLQSPAKQISVLENLDVSHLAMGEHTLNFQFQDESELWSVVSTDSFTKTALPTAAFSIIDNVACVNGPVQFVNESIDTDTWFWDFGDGTTSIEYEPEHVFSETGDFEVSLTATDSESGSENTVTQTLTINPTYETEESVEICSSELPYIFNVQEFTESGTYTETFQTIHGCDSVVTLNLIVNPVYNHTETATICEGENYDFGEKIYTESGEYTEVFESINGCDSTVVLTLTVNPVYSHTDAQAICEEDTYVFGTQNLTTSGEYTEVFESVEGCDSTVVLTLIVNPVYNHTDEQTICEGDTYVFGTQNLTTSGEYTEVFESVEGCDSTVVLTLTVNPGYNHTDEQTICEGDTYVFGNQNLTTSGEYIEVFESVEGCDSTVVLTLSVNPVYNHTDEQTICEGDTYVFGNQNLTTSGEYTEVFESVNGCDSTVILTLTVNPVYNHTETASICEGESYDFDETSYTESGEYTHTFNSVNGCDSIVTLTLTVNPVYDETVEVTMHEDELPYIFGGEDLIEDGVYSKAFASVAGCDSTVTLTLTVLEYSVPVAVCNPISIYLNKTGNYSLSVAELKNIAAGSSDAHTAFADLIISVTPDAFTCADAGNDVNVMVVVTNEDNYADTCYTTVSVADNIAPRVDCHDLEVYLDKNGEAFIDVNEIYADAWDACGIKKISTHKEVFTCDDLGSNYFSASVTDFNRNKKICQNIITIFDTINPSFVPIADTEVAAPAGENMATIDYPDIVATDNCEIENLFLYEGLGPDSEFPVGTTIERWVAVDASGNSDTLSFVVYITGNEPPYVVQPVQDMEMKAGDSLKVFFSAEKGIFFDDGNVDDELHLTLRMVDEGTLPEWLTFRNDSLLAYPAVADTGCINLLLVATDLAGEEAYSPFKLCADFAVGINLPENPRVKVYPNPTTGKVYIDFFAVSGNEVDVSIMDILGKKVLQKKYPTEGQIEVDLSDKVSGIYFLRLKTDDGVELNRKIIVSKEK